MSLPVRFSLGGGRIDCLILAYETPIGITGFHRTPDIPDTAELYLLLGESNYNLIRTSAYATLRILDRGFQDYLHMKIAVYQHQVKYLSALMQMGFVQNSAEGCLITLSVEKEEFQNRKYLF